MCKIPIYVKLSQYALLCGTFGFSFFLCPTPILKLKSQCNKPDFDLNLTWCAHLLIIVSNVYNISVKIIFTCYTGNKTAVISTGSLGTWKTFNSPGISFYDLESLENLYFHQKPPGISSLEPVKVTYPLLFTYFQTAQWFFI